MSSTPATTFQLLPLAIFLGGLVLLFFCLIAGAIAQRRAIRNRPLTDVEILRQNQPPQSSLPGLAGFDGSGRPVHLRLSTEARGAAIVVGVFALIAIGVAWGCLARVMQDSRFAKEGQTATATVQATDVAAAGKGNRVYRVQYEFEVGGQKFEGSGDLPSHESLRNASRKRQVAILYLASDPRISRPSETRDLPLAIVVVTPLVLFMPLLIFALGLKRDRELITQGRFAAGRVIGIASGGRQYSRRCYFDFLDAAGQVRRGSSWLHWYFARQTAVGSVVQVIYLPDDPARNSLLLALSWRV
jgi:hypothetical protein